jgi:phosphatidylinositol alpha-mannosyltransferase
VAVPYQGTVAPICPSPLSLRPIRAALARFRPDVVHAHEPLTPSTSMFAVLASPAPAVGTFHAYAERSGLLTAARPLLRPVWRRLRVRIAVSEAAATFVRSRFGGDVRVVPNGSDVELFAAGVPPAGLPAGRRVLWVARLDPQKGFPVAMRAFEMVSGEFPDLSFVVVGAGREREAAETLDPKVRSRVVMLGAVPNRELPPYFAASEVFVSPVLGQESFGITLVEAMAAGLAVVASDVPGYREVVRDGVDGVLVPPGDAAALAGALRRVLADGAFSSRIRAAARERAAGFSWDQVVPRIEDAYAEALAASR